MLTLGRLATALALLCAAAPVASAQKGSLFSYRAYGGPQKIDDRLAIMPSGLAVASSLQAGQLVSNETMLSKEQLGHLESLFALALLLDDQGKTISGAVTYDLQFCQNGSLQQIKTSQPVNTTLTLVQRFQSLQLATLKGSGPRGRTQSQGGLGAKALEASLPSPVAGQGAQGLTLTKAGRLHFWYEDERRERRFYDQVQLSAPVAQQLMKAFGALGMKSGSGQGAVKVKVYDDNDRVRTLRPEDRVGVLSAFLKAIR